MPNLLNTCQTCAEILFDECSDIVLTPEAGLSANTEYWWFLEDMFGNLWKNTATTDYAGALTIPVDQLPAGLLVASDSGMTITIKETESSMNALALTFDGVVYYCVIATFQHVNETIEE